MSDSETQNVTETEASTETTSTEKAPKRVKQVIFQDANGNEIARRDMTKGRPQRGHRDLPNGDRIVPNCTLNDNGEVQLPKIKSDKPVPQIITLDAEGNEVSRKDKGRGRPAKGSVQQTEGEYAGHWLITLEAETEAPAEAEVVASTETESVVEAEEANEIIVEDAEGWEDVPEEELVG